MNEHISQNVELFLEDSALVTVIVHHCVWSKMSFGIISIQIIQYKHLDNGVEGFGRDSTWSE